MECIKKEFVRTDEKGRKWWRVILTAMEAPEELVLSGADVDNLNDDIRFESGSVLVTPDGEFVACEDENFGTEPRGGIKSASIDPSLPLYDLDGNPTTLDSAFPLYYDQLTASERQNGAIITLRSTENLTDGAAYQFYITPTEKWFASYDTAVGETATINAEAEGNLIVADIGAPEDSGSSTGKVIRAALEIYGNYDPTKPVFVAQMSEAGQLNKTWNEIHNAFFGGAKAVYIEGALDGESFIIPVVALDSVDGGRILARLGWYDWTYAAFFTENLDGYPVLED